MMGIIIYHGSNKVIERPCKKKGNLNNDYGQGFYCTKNYPLAAEWACQNQNDGIVNKYSLEVNTLKVLTLDKEYSILNWLAILLDNRIFTIKTPLAKQARQYIISNFKINYREYDVIIGYRADDSYFSFAEDFISNQISIEKLSDAMYLGELGVQVFLQSEKAIENLIFLSSSEVDEEQYYTKYRKRDLEARNTYNNNKADNALSGLFIRDIIRGGVRNENPSIPRNVLK